MKLLLSYQNIDFINYEDNYPLHLATSKENIYVIKFLLSCPSIDINKKDNKGNTVIYYAISNQNEKIINLLASNPKINLHLYNNSDNTVLFYAFMSSDAAFKILLSNPEIDVNIQNTKKKNTILHEAIEHIVKYNNLNFESQLSKINLLVNHPRINVNIRNKDGKSPLHNAIEKNSIQVLQLLLSKSKTDVNFKYIYDNRNDQENSFYRNEFIYVEKTPLEIAMEKVRNEMIESLLSRPDIDVNTKCTLINKSNNKYEQTPLDIAIKNKNVKLIQKMMLKLRTDEKTKNKYVERLLLFYANDEKYDDFIFLTKQDLGFKLPSKYKSFALYCYTLQNDVDSVKKLLEDENIDINKNNYFNGALNLSVNSGYTKIVELLALRKDADVNRLDTQNKTLLQIAIEKQYLDIVQLLLSRNDININHRNQNDNALIEIAIELKNIEIVKLLLKSSKINISNVNKLKMSALQVAIGYKNLQAIQLLLSRSDVNINYQNINGDTALISTNDIDIVKCILSVPNIDVNIVNLIKISALQIAVQNNNLQIVQLLLSRPDIDVNIPVISSQSYISNDITITSYSKEEKTVLYLAIQNNNLDMFNLILSHKNINVNAKYILTKEYKYSLKSIHYYSKEEIPLLNFVIDKLKNTNLNQKKFFDALISHPKIDVNSVFFIEKSELSFIHEEKTPLYQSIEQQNIEFIDSLLSNPNIDVNLKSTLKYNKSPQIKRTSLHLAVLMANVNAVKSLLKCKNINVNIVDENGKKPIQLTNNNDLIKLLSSIIY